MFLAQHKKNEEYRLALFYNLLFLFYSSQNSSFKIIKSLKLNFELQI